MTDTVVVPREDLQQMLNFIEANMSFSQPNYDSGEEPSDQFTHEAVPFAMALRELLASPALSASEPVAGYIERDFKQAYIQMKERALDAEDALAQLKKYPSDASAKLALLMMKHSFVTGHGDTFDHLLTELSDQLEKRNPAPSVSPSVPTRDEIIIHPRVVELATDEAKRLGKALRLDNMDMKEIYRSLIEVTAQSIAALFAGVKL